MFFFVICPYSILLPPFSSENHLEVCVDPSLFHNFCMFLEDIYIVFELLPSYKRVLRYVDCLALFLLLYHSTCLTVFYFDDCMHSVVFVHHCLLPTLSHLQTFRSLLLPSPVQNMHILSAQVRRFLLAIQQEELLSYVYYVPNCFPR